MSDISRKIRCTAINLDNFRPMNSKCKTLQRKMKTSTLWTFLYTFVHFSTLMYTIEHFWTLVFTFVLLSTLLYILYTFIQIVHFHTYCTFFYIYPFCTLLYILYNFIYFVHFVHFYTFWTPLSFLYTFVLLCTLLYFLHTFEHYCTLLKVRSFWMFLMLWNVYKWFSRKMAWIWEKSKYEKSREFCIGKEGAFYEIALFQP